MNSCGRGTERMQRLRMDPDGSEKLFCHAERGGAVFCVGSEEKQTR